MPVVEFRIRDIVRLRKPHPCGGFEWQVYRLGADIGLRCQTCGHHVMLARPVLEKRLKKFISRGPEIPLSLFFPGLASEEATTESLPRVEAQSDLEEPSTSMIECDMPAERPQTAETT